jgi:hypothetical protein
MKASKIGKNRGEVALIMTLILKDLTINIKHINAQDKARLLNSAFFLTPPEPNLQNI